MLALTHLPSPQLAHCQLTYVQPTPIDYNRALRQHRQYCRLLQKCGCDVQILDINSEFPDSTFIEDTAIVLDEVAVLGSMGTESRRLEPVGIESSLCQYRSVHRIECPATLEGGDVLRVGRTLLVGLSSRTNQAGVRALESIVRCYGYGVAPVPVRGCLHLKTACTALPDQRLLVNPAWVDVQSLSDFDLIRVPESEPWAANVACVEGHVLMSAGHVSTADTVRRMGFDVRIINLSEFAKAEGGVTCLSLIFDPG